MKNISQTSNLQQCYEYENHEISIVSTIKLVELPTLYQQKT